MGGVYSPPPSRSTAVAPDERLRAAVEPRTLANNYSREFLEAS